MVRLETRGLCIQVLQHGGVCWVVLEGGLDMAQSGELSEAFESLLAKGFQTLVCDLAGLTFMDSSGLGVFLHAAGAWREADAVFRLTNARPSVGRMFERTATYKRFEWA